MGAAPTYSSLGSWLSAVETHSQKLVNHRRIRTETLAVHHRLFMHRTCSKLVEPTSAALVIFLLARQARLLIRYDPMKSFASGSQMLLVLQKRRTSTTVIAS